MTKDPKYLVGFKKPPKENQFSPGVSGNPKGRPKGSVSFAAVLQKAASERVVIRENGKTKSVPKLEAVIKQLVNKAAGGDLRAIQMLANLFALHAKEPEEREVRDPLQSNDQQILASLADRMRRAARADFEQLLSEGGDHES